MKAISSQSADFDYLLVSDGACSQNPGPGGWGLIVVNPEGLVEEWGGYEAATTNNRMELFGLYRGLQEVYRHLSALPSKGDARSRVRVISDSKYVLEGAERSLQLWLKRNWKTVAGDPVKNQDLWEKVLKGLTLLKDEGCSFEYVLVKGHAGCEANERVDQIAVKFSRGEAIALFRGKRAEYSISLEVDSKFEPVYLSYVGGKLHRHLTWDECKRATEGKRGARYKKVKNRIEEQETLKAWGLSSGG